MAIAPRTPDNAIAEIAFKHLQSVVRVDTSSNEASNTIPSTPGQAVLAAKLADFFEDLGANATCDSHGNLIAKLPGRGALAEEPPLALAVHLDTARGTATVDSLLVTRAWKGDTLPLPANSSIDVSVDTYPTLAAFVGHDIVHGPGDAPFGLDDKLGLTHLMTLARLLHEHPEVPHRPLLFIGRPDEEIGRMAAIKDIANTLAASEVTLGYTIDGLDAFEINVENFNASGGSILFDPEPFEPEGGHFVRLALGGVNTHGATAKAEGHRTALRFAAEIRETTRGRSIAIAHLESDPLRDCDADVLYWVGSAEDEAALHEAVASVVNPHMRRGASFRFVSTESANGDSSTAVRADGAYENAIAWIAEFLASDPGFPLAAEDSDGFDGYSQPFRVRRDRERVRVDVRIRDFDPAGLARREQHVQAQAGSRSCHIRSQYINMGPALAERPEVVALAKRAAELAHVEPVLRPIRGGTGVDPFLARGIAIGNLGTGYFAPESEKELTSLQLMVSHAKWLFALVQIPMGELGA